MSFTLVQVRLIHACKELSYGYAKFAASVEKQGWCSLKQEATLRKLEEVGTQRKQAWNNAPIYGGSRDLYFTNLEDGGEF